MPRPLFSHTLNLRGTAPGSLWMYTGPVIAPIAPGAIVSIPGDCAVGATGTALIMGCHTIKGRLVMNPSVGSDIAYLTINRSMTAVDDASKPSWTAALSVSTDNFTVGRAPAGSLSGVMLLTVDNAGNLTIPAAHAFNQANPNAKGALLNFGTTGIRLECNDRFNPVVAAPSWQLLFDTSAAASFTFRAAGTGAGTSTQSLSFDQSGNLIITGSIGQKATGTTWANPSDRRLKDEIVDYSTGLAAVCALQPRTFVYNGKGGSTAGLEGSGFISDEVAPVMPEMIQPYMAKLEPDDEDETELYAVDQSNLILALVNAVKELTARVEELEQPGRPPQGP